MNFIFKHLYYETIAVAYRKYCDSVLASLRIHDSYEHELIVLLEN